MKRDRKTLLAEISADLEKARGIQAAAKDEDRDLTDEETQQISDLADGVEAKQAEVEKLESRNRIAGKLDAADKFMSSPAPQHLPRPFPPMAQQDSDFRVPAAPKRYTGRTVFTGPDADAKAYTAGQWFRSLMFGNDQARRWCENNGIQYRAALSTGTNTAGGYLVPTVLSTEIIRLVETYGVFRRNARIWPVNGGDLLISRRATGITAYFVGENAAPTEADMAWDQIRLVPKQLATLSRYPLALAEDAIIDIGEAITQEIAQAFALQEDQCGFIGTGTSTYGGIHGAFVKIDDGTHTASIATAVTGNTAFSTLDLVDFHSAVGKLPVYARPNARWYVSAPGYADSMERLAYAGGGNTVQTIGGGMGLSFLGYPVEIVQVANSTLTAQTSTLIILFGDLRMGAAMGVSSEMSVAFSTDRYFDTLQVAVRGLERFDINVHGLGDTSTAGCIVGIKTPGS